MLFGMGDTINKAKATAYPAGSFIMVPTGVHHWSVAKGDTIEQVSGEGPLTNIPIKHGACNHSRRSRASAGGRAEALVAVRQSATPLYLPLSRHAAAGLKTMVCFAGLVLHE